MLRHIGIYTVVTVAPRAVSQRGDNQFYFVCGVGTLCNNFFQCGNFLGKVFFTHFTEIHLSVFIPVHGGEYNDRTVNIIITRIVADIIRSLCKNFCRNVAVQALICRYLKILCRAGRLVVKLQGLDFYRGIGVSEFVDGKSDSLRFHRIKTAKAHGLNFFALIHGHPFTVHKCLQTEILCLIADFFNNCRVDFGFFGQLQFHIAVVCIRKPFGRRAVRRLCSPAFIIVSQQIDCVCLFAFL